MSVGLIRRGNIPDSSRLRAHLTVSGITRDRRSPRFRGANQDRGPDPFVTGTVEVETVPPVATHWKLSTRTVESYGSLPVSQMAKRIVNVLPPCTGAEVTSHVVPPPLLTVPPPHVSKPVPWSSASPDGQ